MKKDSLNLDKIFKDDTDYTDVKVVSALDMRKPKIWISTGDKLLDMVMGGGIPVGKFVEIYGEPSTSKTTLAMQAVNYVINVLGGLAYVNDTEGGTWEFPNRNLELGLNPDRIKRCSYYRPTSVEDLFTRLEKFILKIVKLKIKVPILIVWDSIAASTAQREIDDAYGKQTYAIQAKIISQAHRKLVSLIVEHNIENVTFLWLNQAKVSQEQTAAFMPKKWVTFGGDAPKFYASIRVELLYGKVISTKKRRKTFNIGAEIKVKTTKNKLFDPFQTTRLHVLKRGTNNARAVYSWLKELDLIDDVSAAMKTRWKNGEKLFQNIDPAIELENCPTKNVRLLSGLRLGFTTEKSFYHLYKDYDVKLHRLIEEDYKELLDEVFCGETGLDYKKPDALVRDDDEADEE